MSALLGSQCSQLLRFVVGLCSPFPRLFPKLFPNSVCDVRPFRDLCVVNSLHLSPRWGRDVRPFGISVFFVLRIWFPAELVMSAPLDSLFSIPHICCPAGVIVMPVLLGSPCSQVFTFVFKMRLQLCLQDLSLSWGRDVCPFGTAVFPIPDISLPPGVVMSTLLGHLWSQFFTLPPNWGHDVSPLRDLCVLNSLHKCSSWCAIFVCSILDSCLPGDVCLFPALCVLELGSSWGRDGRPFGSSVF